MNTSELFGKEKIRRWFYFSIGNRILTGIDADKLVC